MVRFILLHDFTSKEHTNVWSVCCSNTVTTTVIIFPTQDSDLIGQNEEIGGPPSRTVLLISVVIEMTAAPVQVRDSERVRVRVRVTVRAGAAAQAEQRLLQLQLEVAGRGAVSPTIDPDVHGCSQTLLG